MLLLLSIAFSATAQRPGKQEVPAVGIEKLKQHREAVKNRLRMTRHVTGRVTRIQPDDQILTDITEELLQQAKIEH